MLGAPSEAAFLDCCFSEDVAFSVGSEGCVRRSIRYWDTRMNHKASCSKDVNAVIESMSLSGFDLLVATGNSVNQYDSRSLERPFWGIEALRYNRIRCISSGLHCKGYAVGSVDGHVALDIFLSSNSHSNGSVGSFATGDDQGYISVWDALTKNRLLELPKLPNSAAYLAFNHNSRLLAAASSFTYQEANELEEHEMDRNDHVSVFAGSSTMVLRIVKSQKQ